MDARFHALTRCSPQRSHGALDAVGGDCAAGAVSGGAGTVGAGAQSGWVHSGSSTNGQVRARGQGWHEPPSAGGAGGVYARRHAKGASAVPLALASGMPDVGGT